MSLRLTLFKAALDALLATGAHRWLAPLSGGVGAIFMLHHVRPWKSDGFAPNRHLEITPEFLDAAIGQVRARGFDLVSLDEAHRRLTSPGATAPFAAFTLDDGYRDNAIHALPVFERHDCPATIYVPSDFAEGQGVLWWVVLEEAVRRVDRIALPDAIIETRTAAQKSAAFALLFARVTERGEPSRHPLVGEVATQAGFEPADPCRRLCMGWTDLEVLSRHRLVTIGAHTRSHPMLARIAIAEAVAEIAEGRRRLEAKLGRRIDHFAYPVGSSPAAGRREFELIAKAGFKTAVTTRRGLLHHRHRRTLTHLPRVSLNGHFQTSRYLDLFLSGVPFALSRGFTVSR
jgi:peptidoglycan/xylan/chitin deacetylase (PgdA/CDA1 family)